MQDQVAALQPQNGAQVTVSNQTPFQMTLLRSRGWSGMPANPGFPEHIAPGIPAMFTHLATGNFGSKAAVVYEGLNESGIRCSWVLAWDAPADSTPTPNKVFVLCGSSDTIKDVSFDQIRMFLDASANISAAHYDEITKTRADANIHDFAPGTATVSANFGLIPIDEFLN